MADKFVPASLKGFSNVVVGGGVLTASVGAIWILISGIGALVANATIWLGGKPAMWTIVSVFENGAQPSNAEVAIGFFFCVITTTVLLTLVLLFLAGFGESVMDMFRKKRKS